MYTVTFGRRPGSKMKTSNSLLLFKPKESMNVDLAREYDEMSHFLSERHLIESINEIKLEVGFIVFEDGTASSLGTPMRQDPDNPDRYIPVENEQSLIQKRVLWSKKSPQYPISHMEGIFGQWSKSKRP